MLVMDKHSSLLGQFISYAYAPITIKLIIALNDTLMVCINFCQHIPYSQILANKARVNPNGADSVAIQRTGS
jgi:hypothetical protein